MNSKPKIIVFRVREMIYTLLLVVFAVLLIICLFLMFSGRTATKNQNTANITSDTQNSGSQQTESSRTQSTDLQQKDSQTQSTDLQQKDSQARSTDLQQKDSQAQSTSAQQSASSLQAVSSSVTAENTFIPGIYTVPLYLNGASLEVEVTVDADHINSIRLVNLSESVEAMYPLMSPSLNHIATQILQKQSLDEITSPQENRYTSQMLLNAISAALELAH